MLKNLAGAAVAGLVLALAPPLDGTARADSWAVEMARDYVDAYKITRGEDVTIALLGDGVAKGVDPLEGALEKGIDLVDTPRPRSINGTLVASFIVGGGPTSDTPWAVRGLASDANLLPVRVHATDDEPGGKEWWDTADWDGALADGIRQSVDRGADVIALLAGTPSDTRVGPAVQYALSKNVVIVTTVLTQDRVQPDFPSALPGVIGVGAVKANGKRYAKFTDRSSAVLVAAPGAKMLTTGPGNRLYTFWGAGPSTAFGASTAALVRSEYPKLTPAQVAEAISRSARHPDGEGKYDADLGFGYINPAGALSIAKELAAKPAPARTAPSGVADDTRFGPEPENIRAAPLEPLYIGGFAALALLGVCGLVFAGWLAMRRRPAPVPEPAEPEVEGSESLPS